MTYNQLLDKYEEYGNVCMILLLHHSKLDQTQIVLNLDKKVNFDLAKFEADMQEYINGKPVQHITGYEYFLGRKFSCGNGAFIPRYETEELVENALYRIDEMFEDQHITLADIGTGSGIISISLDLETDSTTYATEISDEAATVAKQNNKDLKGKVEILVGNMLDPLIEKGIKLDVLISNPPYIPRVQEKIMDTRVTKHDPHVALFGKGEDGLGFYEEIFINCNKVLKDKWLMGFEFGFDQKENLEALVKQYFPTNKYEFLQDINGKWRMLFIYSN